MDFKRFEDIQANKNHTLVVLYYHACRNMRRFNHELEVKGALDGKTHFYLERMKRKFEQLVAKGKSLEQEAKNVVCDGKRS